MGRQIADFIHTYRATLETPGQCHVRVYQLDTGLTVVVASELPGNSPRASVTNVAEQLATEIRARFVVPGAGMVWIEHYPGTGSGARQETFDRVLFRWDGEEYTEPEWKPSTRAQVEALIGQSLGDGA